MKPVSECTTPRRLICPISRHFFPDEQPDPVGCCTTGLKKGSRFPLIAHFFSSGFGGFGASAVLAASAVLLAATGLSFAAIFVAAGAGALSAGLVAATLAVATGAAAAGVLGANISCGFTVAVAGAGLLLAAGAVTGEATAGLAATICGFGAGAAVFAGAGAGAFFATAACVCSVKTKLLPGPGVNS